MGSYVLVVFVSRIPAGTVFARARWPLHATLVRFDAAEPAARIRQRIGPALTARAAFAATVGGDAAFGRDGSVPVSLLDADSGLAALHVAVLDALGDAVHLPGGRHTKAGYRPHVSHTVGRLHPSDTLAVDHVALVDMRPDGDPRWRRVVFVWDLAPGPIQDATS